METINYELLNQFLKLAIGIEVYSLIAAFYFFGRWLGRVFEEVVTDFRKRKKKLDNKDNK